MNKKMFFIFFILSFLFISLFLPVKILAQEEILGISGLNPEEIEETKFKLAEKWEYLSNEWKDILVKKPVISQIDSFLTKNSYVFKVLFGTNYSFSITSILIILLFVLFIFTIKKLMSGLIKIKPIFSCLVAVVLSILLSQTKVFLYLAKILIWLPLSKENIWWNVILVVIEIIAIFFILALISNFAKTLEERRKKKEEDKEKEQNKEAREKVKQIEKRETEEEKDENLKEGKGFLRTFGEELRKEKGEEEFNIPDFDEPEFEKP